MTTPPAPSPIAPASLNQAFLIGASCLIAGVVLWIVFIGIPIFIVGIVFMAIFIYRCWTLIQDGPHRTTPGLAVGLMFIPLFNMYWQFVAFAGLAKDLNAYARERSLSAPRANEGVALAACILSISSLIPLIGIFTGLAGMICWIIAALSIKNAAVAIAGAKDNAPPAPDVAAVV